MPYENEVFYRAIPTRSRRRQACWRQDKVRVFVENRGNSDGACGGVFATVADAELANKKRKAKCLALRKNLLK